MGFYKDLGNVQEQEGSENKSTSGKVDVEAWKMLITNMMGGNAHIHQRHDRNSVMAPPIRGPLAEPRFPTSCVNEWVVCQLV